MENVLLIYIITQLISTAYGLSVIETVKPIVKQKLYDEGYVLKNKNSMYKFNEGIANVLKGLIPFYYATKAIKLVRGNNAIDASVMREIKNGNYITKEEYNDMVVVSEKKNLIEVKSEPNVSFEKPEKYTARKNNYILTETNEEEVKYEEEIETRSDKLEITPFASSYIKPKEKELTTTEIVNSLIDMDANSLTKLNTKLNELIQIKKGNKVLKLKDVA